MNFLPGHFPAGAVARAPSGPGPATATYTDQAATGSASGASTVFSVDIGSGGNAVVICINGRQGERVDSVEVAGNLITDSGAFAGISNYASEIWLGFISETGTQNVEVFHSTAPGNGRLAISVYRVANLESITPVDFDASSGGDPSFSLSTSDGGCIIACGTATTTPIFSWGGGFVSEDHVSNVESGQDYTSASGNGADGASKTISLTITSASNKSGAAVSLR